jgi:hypothetical protein
VYLSSRADPVREITQLQETLSKLVARLNQKDPNLDIIGELHQLLDATAKHADVAKIQTSFKEALVPVATELGAIKRQTAVLPEIQRVLLDTKETIAKIATPPPAHSNSGAWLRLIRFMVFQSLFAWFVWFFATHPSIAVTCIDYVHKWLDPALR